MSIRRKVLGIALLGAALAPASAMAWTRAYVADWIEPAFYYGGPANGGAASNGTDCPTGLQKMDWDKLLITGYRGTERVAEVRNAEYSRPGFLSHLGFRGPHKENLYENPTAIPDPGLKEVEGRIAEGLDLDGNTANGFTGVNGETGIDNAFYKVAGCLNLLRGRAKDGFVQKVANEAMRNGATTVLMIMSGEGDPMNDDNVQVGVFTSKDRIVKDANSGVVSDYSFNLDRDGPSTLFKARIKNGVLENIDRPTLKIDYSWRKGNPRVKPVELFESRIRLNVQPDGSLQGVAGGYRPFIEHFLEVSLGETIDSAITENLGHTDLSGYYYSLRRNADGLKDPVTGKNTGISTWFNMNWTPAFVIDPRDGKQISVASLAVEGK